VKDGIQHIISDLEKELSSLEKSVKPTWEDLVEPLERISDRIGRAWGTVSHLKVSKVSTTQRSRD
jgi:oligopeptidase A